MIDFLFIEFYIKKKYSKSLMEYFNVTNVTVSRWKKENKIPSDRIIEFNEREKSIDIRYLIENLYNLV